MKTTTEMQLVPLEKLVPYANNARTHSAEQINKLRSSLREFGFINPVIIDRDYGVIAGHGRILAAKEEDIQEIPCVFADHLTEAQKKAYIIADNRMAMDAGWDEELLRVEIEALQAETFNLSLTGFDEKELSDLFKDDADVHEDDFDVDAELKQPVITRAGDVWTLGRHRLVCGDSTKAETFALLMGNRRANLVITDPPYNVNYEGSAGKIKNDNMADDAFYQFLLAAFQNTEAVMADDASIYVFHADTEGLNFRRAFADAGFRLSGTCIWKKQSLVLGRSPYQWQHTQAQVVGKWEDEGRVPDGKRLTWFYPDFGCYVVKEFVSPERLAECARGVELQQEAAGCKRARQEKPPIAAQLREAGKLAGERQAPSAPKRNTPDRGDR